MAEAHPLYSSALKNLQIPVEGADPLDAYQSNTEATLGVVLIQEWWGLNIAMQNTAEEFAAEGFRVVVPDLYRGKLATDRETAGHLLSGLDWAGAVRDIAATVAYLKANGCNKVGVAGFCMGGALTVASLANIPAVDAASVFYGCPDVATMDFAHVKNPVLLHFGETDDMQGFSDPATAAKLRDRLTECGVTATLYMYPGAGHAFTNRDRPEAFHAESRNLAFKRSWDYFRTYLQ